MCGEVVDRGTQHRRLARAGRTDDHDQSVVAGDGRGRLVLDDVELPPSNRR